ncbi:MAG: 1,4-dihydroxy-2-naphthoate octaprenyltransferase, partial [Desulfobacterales bacterium]|nr:1,4-dihydroxy-2-naphthoate octaprenyltransferase [Desulfobacterales bacterium]
DSEERLGPIRVTQSGLIPPGAVKSAMALVLALAAAVGCYLTWVAGLPVVVIAGAAILSALAYSGGPYPLASHGLGDPFVFIFFGPVAVCGTYYVQALALTGTVLLMSAPVGLLITAILVVNNLRDINTDQKAGKNTLAVKLGARGARIEYALLLVAAFALPIVHLIAASTSLWLLLPIASAPIALKRIRDIHARTGRELNQTLADTALLALIFSLLQSAGIMLG